MLASNWADWLSESLSDRIVRVGINDIVYNFYSMFVTLFTRISNSFKYWLFMCGEMIGWYFYKFLNVTVESLFWNMIFWSLIHVRELHQLILHYCILLRCWPHGRECAQSAVCCGFHFSNAGGGALVHARQEALQSQGGSSGLQPWPNAFQVINRLHLINWEGTTQLLDVPRELGVLRVGWLQLALSAGRLWYQVFYSQPADLTTGQPSSQPTTKLELLIRVFVAQRPCGCWAWAGGISSASLLTSSIPPSSYSGRRTSRWRRCTWSTIPPCPSCLGGDQGQ